MSSPSCISILEKIFNFTVTQYLGSLGEKHKRPDVTTRGLLDAWLRYFEGEFANKTLIEVAVRQTLEIRRRVLPDEHTDILESLNDLDLSYMKLSRYQEAETLFLKAVKSAFHVFGDKHRFTLDFLNSLIELYETWGKPKKTEEWRSKLPETEAVQK